MEVTLALVEWTFCLSIVQPPLTTEIKHNCTLECGLPEAENYHYHVICSGISSRQRAITCTKESECKQYHNRSICETTLCSCRSQLASIFSGSSRGSLRPKTAIKICIVNFENKRKNDSDRWYEFSSKNGVPQSNRTTVHFFGQRLTDIITLMLGGSMGVLIFGFLCLVTYKHAFKRTPSPISEESTFSLEQDGNLQQIFYTDDSSSLLDFNHLMVQIPVDDPPPPYELTVQEQPSAIVRPRFEESEE